MVGSLNRGLQHRHQRIVALFMGTAPNFGKPHKTVQDSMFILDLGDASSSTPRSVERGGKDLPLVS